MFPFVCIDIRYKWDKSERSPRTYKQLHNYLSNNINSVICGVLTNTYEHNGMDKAKLHENLRQFLKLGT